MSSSSAFGIVDADLVLRSSSRHWLQLSRLLAGLERCAESCARLDAHRAARGRAPQSRRFYRDLDAVGRRIDREMDKATSERLRVDLAAKINAQREAGGVR